MGISQCALSVLAALVMNHEATYEWFGHSIVVMGDLDGDEVDDFLVSSPKEGATPGDAGPYGMVRAFSGSSGELVFEARGQGGFGDSIARIGDLDGDGIAEFVAGLAGLGPSGEGPTGFVVCDGSSGQELYSVLREGGAACKVATVGDLDGDGHVDYATSWPGMNLDGEPRAVSRIEIRAGQSGEVLVQVVSEDGVTQIGRRLWDLPDMNGDGLPDFAFTKHVGRSWGSPARVVIASGSSGAAIHEIVPRRSSTGDGPSLAVTGDHDGDSVPDLLVGTSEHCGVTLEEFGPDGVPEWPEEIGEVGLYSGREGAPLGVLTPCSATPTFGHALAAGADIDGDGIDDFLITEYENIGMLITQGRCLLLSGRDGTLLREHKGTPWSAYGASLCLLGDLDDDGISEYAVGALISRAGSSGPGQVVVHSGKSGEEMYRLP